MEARARAHTDGGAKSTPSFFFNWCKSETLWALCAARVVMHAIIEKYGSRSYYSGTGTCFFCLLFCFVFAWADFILLGSHADFIFFFFWTYFLLSSCFSIFLNSVKSCQDVSWHRITTSITFSPLQTKMCVLLYRSKTRENCTKKPSQILILLKSSLKEIYC